MKKYTIIFTMLLFGMVNSLNAQQMYGKWIVPTDSLSVRITHELIFSENGISSETLPLESYSNPLEFSAGGYNDNYDLRFYVLGELFCYGDNAFDWMQIQSADLNPEFQIIQKPSIPDEHFSFYTGTQNTGKSEQNCFYYNEITIIDNQVNVSDNFSIRSGLDDDQYVAFAITPKETTPRYLYASTGRNDAIIPTYYAGLRKWEVTTTGMEYMELIIDENTEGFDEYDFDAYNLELKIDDNNTIIAFIHGTKNESPSYNQIVTELIVVIDGDGEKYELNSGRLAGIEFSTFEENMIYVSSEDGLLKVNYTNGDIVQTLSQNDFQRTFLQTAPDGHIYGVSNSGNTLGQINMQTGTFTGNSFAFPENHQVITTKEFEDELYYILPENSNTYEALEAEAFPRGVLCPGYTNGEVTIYVYGGVPFEAPNDPYIIDCTPTVQFSWDEDIEAFIATGLGEDTYDYTITDQYNTIIGQFTIVVDYSGYTHKVHKTFSESDTWNEYSESFALGFTIDNNAQITVQNSTLLMGELANIIIEPGSELIVNNSTITHYPECGPWLGIEIWGNSNESQYIGEDGIMHQGKLVIEDSSFIKNAWNAVTTQNPDNFYSHGGIIIAENSTFENNKRSVEILQYQNFHPDIPEMKLPYVHRFKNCTFVTDDSYLFSTELDTHVSMWDVYGIKFMGCKFKNNNTAAPHTGHGINSSNAGYSLLNYCSSNTQPCLPDDIVYNEFHNLYKGVHASNSSSSRNTIYVNDANFINNSIGVYISAVDYATIVKSRFEIGYNDRDGGNCDNCTSFGIDVHSALGYVIENNYFTKLQGAPAGNYVGVRLYETFSIVDEIYNNEFEGLSIGNLSEKYNRPNIFNDGDGVAYLCNDNFDNNFDFYVADNSIIKGGIGSDIIPSGNTLSQNAEMQFQNDYTQDIRYYYYNGEQNEILTLYSNHVFPYAVSSPNPCPDHYSNGGGIGLTSAEKLQKEQDYNQNMVDYNNVVNLFETLKDDGDTPLMENEVETAWPNEMWDLRTDLLASSPYLSYEVLVEVADKTEVFPESVQFDIFAANPDEMRNEEFLLHLENKEESFPDYMIDMLRQIGYGSSYKTVLLNQISTYYTTAIGAAQDIVRSEMFDSIVDFNEVRTWLGNIGTYSADKQIVSTYLQEDSLTLAGNLLGTLPTTHSLSTDQMLAYNDYSTLVQLHINLAQQGRNIMQLDSTEIATVVDIADNGMGSAVAQARNILSMLFGNYYYDCPALPENLELKRHGVSRNSSNDALFVVAKPNPASTWVAFDYQLPFYAKEGIIKIADITGNVLATIQVTGSIGQKTWDVRNIKSGVYLYILEAGGTTKSGKLIIQ